MELKVIANPSMRELIKIANSTKMKRVVNVITANGQFYLIYE